MMLHTWVLFLLHLYIDISTCLSSIYYLSIYGFKYNNSKWATNCITGFLEVNYGEFNLYEDFDPLIWAPTLFLFIALS